VSELWNSPEGQGYDGAAVLGGVLATVFFPVISLIAALLLQGSQPDPVKRGQLRTWAWVSAGWLAVQAIIFVIAVAALSSSVHGGPLSP
jgi:uncharacterized membrane protein